MQGHVKWCMTAKCVRWTWFTANRIIHTLKAIISLLTGILCNFRDRCFFLFISPHCSRKWKKKPSSADMSCSSRAHIGCSLTCFQVSITAQGAVCFHCSEHYSLNKSARVPAKIPQLHVIALSGWGIVTVVGWAAGMDASKNNSAYKKSAAKPNL